MSLGIGAMLHSLGGGSAHSPNEYYGKEISDIKMDDKSLFIDFTNCVKIRIFDDGQSCCESRYMRTDDDMRSLIGKTLVSIETKDAPDIEDEYGVHQVVFLEIRTNDGWITISNHNEHNGYYGGFGLSIEEIK